MRYLTLITFLFFVLPSFSQQLTPEAKKGYAKLQHQLDKQHCGLGIELSKPRLGDNFTINEKWTGFNILADIAEIKFGFGRVTVDEGSRGIWTGSNAITEVHAKYFSIGANIPIKFGAFGFQGSAFKQFRAYPFIGASLNWAKFKPEGYNSYSGRIINFTASPGYRARVPFGSIDFGIDLNLGLQDGLGPGSFKIYSRPYIALRFDALKSKLQPEIVHLNAVHGGIANLELDSKTYTDYSPSGYNAIVTETTASYDVVASSGLFGFQDMGYFFGIGPRIGINNLASEKLQTRGFMAGLSAHARASILYLGLNFETGKMGHATTMKYIWGEYEERKIDQVKTWGKGSLNNTKIFGDIGVDITPLIIAMTGTGIQDYASVTPFTSLMFGASFGHSIVGNQEFESNTAAGEMEQFFQLNSSIEKTKFNDPRLSSSGFVGGWFLTIQLGALEFRMQKYRFKNSPLSNNKVLSVTYRVPLAYPRKLRIFGRK